MTTPDDIARKAVELARSADRDAAVADLVALADHRRQPLEQATAIFIARLHRRSDDFEATHALRLLYRALAGAGWDRAPAPAAAQGRASLPARIARLFHSRRTATTATAAHPRAAAA